MAPLVLCSPYNGRFVGCLDQLIHFNYPRGKQTYIISRQDAHKRLIYGIGMSHYSRNRIIKIHRVLSVCNWSTRDIPSEQSDDRNAINLIVWATDCDFLVLQNIYDLSVDSVPHTSHATYCRSSSRFQVWNKNKVAKVSKILKWKVFFRYPGTDGDANSIWVIAVVTNTKPIWTQLRPRTVTAQNSSQQRRVLDKRRLGSSLSSHALRIHCK